MEYLRQLLRFADRIKNGRDAPLRALTVVTAALFLVILALRTGQIASHAPSLTQALGWYGPSFDRLMTFALAGALTALLGCALRLRAIRRQAQNPSEPGAVVNSVITAFGLVAAATSVVAIAFPDTPYSVAAPACRGAQVRGAVFFAQTPDVGVSARIGPGTGYRQAARFGGGCTLGFSGYCVGQPIPSGVDGLVDTRWLILNGTKRLVSSAVMLVQSQPVAGGASRPDPECAKLGGVLAPSRVIMQAGWSADNREVVNIEVTDTDAPLVGYALKVVDPRNGQYPYSPIESPRSNSPTFAGTWLAGTDAALLKNGTGNILLAASACLSGNFPTGKPDVLEARFRDGRLIEISPLRQLPTDADVLARTACYGTPS
jgi:hypothetical protein